MNRRLRDNIGLSTSPAIGSNVIVPLLLHSVNTYLFAGGRFRPPFYVLSLGINDRRIINQEAVVENKNASKKKTEEPMSLKDRRYEQDIKTLRAPAA